MSNGSGIQQQLAVIRQPLPRDGLGQLAAELIALFKDMGPQCLVLHLGIGGINLPSGSFSAALSALIDSACRLQ